MSSPFGPSPHTAKAVRTGFVSYARNKTDLATDFCRCVTKAAGLPRCVDAPGADLSVEGWWDYQIRIGAKGWFEQIVEARNSRHFGVLLLSNGLAASTFARQHEMAPMLEDETRPVFIVGLSEVPPAHLKGLALSYKQFELFRPVGLPHGLWFEGLGPRNRSLYAQQFLEHIYAELAEVPR